MVGAGLAMAIAVLRRRGLVLAAIMVGGGIAATSILLNRQYTAEVRFAPSVTQAPSGMLAGIAAQFGVPLSGDGATSIDFYRELVRSRAVLGAVVTTPLDTMTTCPDREGTSYVQFVQPEGETEDEKLLSAIEDFRNQLVVIDDVVAGIVTVRVTTGCAAMAELLAELVVARVNDYNRRTRQSSARAEREFIETRLEKAQDELREMEDSLAAFLEANRTYASSPRLSFEVSRLQRRVDLAQQLVLTLSESFERARIDEVRDTPVLTVVDSASGSALPSRGVLPWTVVGALTGLVVGVLGVVLIDAGAGIREQYPQSWAKLKQVARLRR
jgi:uncharacterized protein involved in exopolysaccharide biosynthesis